MGIFFPTVSVLVRLPIRHQPLWGDDALLLRASQMPHGYASSLTESFFQTGSFKYRPITTPILSVFVSWFGNDIFWYQIVNTAFIGVLAFIVFLICASLSNSRLLGIFAGILVILTRFNWYSQDYVFGLMEITALLLFTGCLGLVIAALRQEDVFILSMSQGLLLMCTLTHERYVLVSLAIPMGVVVSAFVTQILARRLVQRSLWFLAIPLIHIVVKSELLMVSPLTGGGESDFNKVKGFWILRHFLEAVWSLFGLSNGYENAAQESRLNPLVFVATTLLTTGVVFLVLVQKFFVSFRKKSPEIAIGIVLLAVFGSVTFSASLVIERIEYRWLFPSFITFLFLASWVMSSGSHRLRMAVFAVAISMAATEFAYQPFHRIIALSPSRVEAAVSALRGRGQDGPWKLIVMPKNWEHSWQWWSFGYGDVFFQMDNPPMSVSIVGDERSASEECDKDWILSYCTLLIVDGQSTDVSVLDFRIAKY